MSHVLLSVCMYTSSTTTAAGSPSSVCSNPTAAACVCTVMWCCVCVSTYRGSADIILYTRTYDWWLVSLTCGANTERGEGRKLGGLEGGIGGRVRERGGQFDLTVLKREFPKAAGRQDFPSNYLNFPHNRAGIVPGESRQTLPLYEILRGGGEKWLERSFLWRLRLLLPFSDLKDPLARIRRLLNLLFPLFENSMPPFAASSPSSSSPPFLPPF